MEQNPIQEAIDYLKANDNYDGEEGALAARLEGCNDRIESVLRDATYALGRASEDTGDMAEGDDELNAPWNEGGYGYEAHMRIMALRDGKPEPTFVEKGDE